MSVGSGHTTLLSVETSMTPSEIISCVKWNDFFQCSVFALIARRAAIDLAKGSVFRVSRQLARVVDCTSSHVKAFIHYVMERFTLYQLVWEGVP